MVSRKQWVLGTSSRFLRRGGRTSLLLVVKQSGPADVRIGSKTNQNRATLAR